VAARSVPRQNHRGLGQPGKRAPPPGVSASARWSSPRPSGPEIAATAGDVAPVSGGPPSKAPAAKKKNTIASPRKKIANEGDPLREGSPPDPVVPVIPCRHAAVRDRHAKIAPTSRTHAPLNCKKNRLRNCLSLPKPFPARHRLGPPSPRWRPLVGPPRYGGCWRCWLGRPCSACPGTQPARASVGGPGARWAGPGLPRSLACASPPLLGAGRPGDQTLRPAGGPTHLPPAQTRGQRFPDKIRELRLTTSPGRTTGRRIHWVAPPCRPTAQWVGLSRHTSPQPIPAVPAENSSTNDPVGCRTALLRCRSRGPPSCTRRPWSGSGSASPRRADDPAGTRRHPGGVREIAEGLWGALPLGSEPPFVRHSGKKPATGPLRLAGRVTWQTSLHNPELLVSPRPRLSSRSWWCRAGSLIKLAPARGPRSPDCDRRPPRCRVDLHPRQTQNPLADPLRSSRAP